MSSSLASQESQVTDSQETKSIIYEKNFQDGYGNVQIIMDNSKMIYFHNGSEDFDPTWKPASSQDSDSTWYPSESETESESEADTIPETDTFYDTQNDFKLLGELLNGSSSSNSQ